MSNFYLMKIANKIGYNETHRVIFALEVLLIRMNINVH